ncbi:MAG: ERAD-associated protein [Phylliscum demangeonii]|nr:MAG: ERAD-associated protein [Phylliscum demangeonii]
MRHLINTATSLAPSTSSSKPPLYFYSIVPTAHGLAISSSDNAVRVLDGATLGVVPTVHLCDVDEGLICLKVSDPAGHVLATAGRDGCVRCWDMRTRSKVLQYNNVSLKDEKIHGAAKVPLLSLCFSPRKNLVAAGTERSEGQSVVLLRYNESHYDDVTEVSLQFDPTRTSHLLSGSTDGLINIFNTYTSNEDDALRRTINHGSSVRRAGFLDGRDLFALSHDETFAVYHLSDADEDPAPTSFGDLRDRFHCKYVVDIVDSYADEGPFFDSRRSRLPNAHGEDIVRTVYLNARTETVFTAGEDGLVKAWRPAEIKEEKEKGHREEIKEEEEKEHREEIKEENENEYREEIKEEKEKWHREEPSSSFKTAVRSKRTRAVTTGLFEETTNESRTEQAARAQPSIGAQTADQHGPPGDNRTKSSDLVAEALELLRHVEPKTNRSSRHGKPGLLGATASYAREMFFTLFMNGPQTDGDTLRPDKQPGKAGQSLQKAINLLERAAEGKNAIAMFLLAEMNFHGNYNQPKDYSAAARWYHDVAAITANGSAQHMLGFMYATGIGGAVEADQAKAMLYYTFAALGGESRSEMTMGFRHQTGIGTPRNCERAAFYYKQAADKAIAVWRSGPPGGKTMFKLGYRLADDHGGVYGQGASVTSAGIHAVQGGPNSGAHAAFDDVLEYLDLMSRKGDLKATLSLGRLHYDGSRAMNRNVKKARAYFTLVAKKYWTRDGRVVAGVDPVTEKAASKAAGYLGRMFLRGEGTDQSLERALVWFRRGVDSGDSIAQYGMGMMYLHGLGLPRDAVKAAGYFKASADQDHAPAQVSLGALFLDQGDLQVAIKYFELAARHGHIEAFYYLAEIANRGVGRDRSCGVATAYYKIVAERAEELHSTFGPALQAYESGDMDSALVYFLMAAEQGYEIGQANVGYLLDEEKSQLPLKALRDSFPTQRQPARTLLRPDPRLALIHWTRSAKQSNIDSMVKTGDYYFRGIGTEPDPEKAAACYQAAAEFQQSAQALWNLGWMHENGIGVQQDFHLAKRYYDLALETNQEAYLPVTLSLVKLRLRSFWNTVTYGRVKSIQSEPEPKAEWSYREWINNFLRDDHPYYGDGDGDEAEDESEHLVDSAAAHEHMHGGGGGAGDELYADLIDDGIIESLIIVGLAAALAFLVYYRQQRQLGIARRAANPPPPTPPAPPVEPAAPAPPGPEAAAVPGVVGVVPEAPAPPPDRDRDRGLFPAAGDADYGQWVAGGVAH